MKKRFLRVLALALMLALAAGALSALAEAKKAKIITEKLYSNTGDYCIQLDNWTDDEEIVSVKSSNSKVIRVPRKESKWVEVKSAGKAKITIKYKLNGKTYTTSATFTVEKYPAPIKSLAVNGKSIKLTGEEKVRYNCEYVLDKKVSITINLKTKNGWKISSIKAYTFDAWSDKGNKKTIIVRNNKKFTVPGDKEAYVTYVLKKNKATFRYTIGIMRYGE